jgi:hypothetical protein
MRDNISNVQYVNLGSLTLSGVTPGLSGYLDTRGFDAASIVVVNGTITDAGTASGFTVTSDTADDVVAGAVGYAGNARYIGVTVTGTTGTNAVITLLGVLSKPSAAETTLAGAVVART